MLPLRPVNTFQLFASLNTSTLDFFRSTLTKNPVNPERRERGDRNYC
jgi:hypothetical protein